MKIVMFGATGMVGQGVLREALAAQDVTHVLSIGRSDSETSHPKLRTLVHADLLDYSAIEDLLTGFDACFFCLGASAPRRWAWTKPGIRASTTTSRWRPAKYCRASTRN